MTTLVLENDAIYSLTKNKTVVDAFPFLKAAAAAPSRTCCGGVIPGQTATDYAAIKNTIAGLPSEVKERFKAVLGVDKVVVYHNDMGRQLLTEF